MPFEKDPDEIGALWTKSGRKGDYFTGSIEMNGEKHAIVIFPNGNKRSDKSPDFRILKAKRREDAPASPIADAMPDFDPPF